MRMHAPDLLAQQAPLPVRVRRYQRERDLLLRLGRLLLRHLRICACAQPNARTARPQRSQSMVARRIDPKFARLLQPLGEHARTRMRFKQIITRTSAHAHARTRTRLRTQRVGAAGGCARGLECGWPRPALACLRAPCKGSPPCATECDGRTSLARTHRPAAAEAEQAALAAWPRLLR
jgi:hypothetical protein